MDKAIYKLATYYNKRHTNMYSNKLDIYLSLTLTLFNHP